MEQYQEVCRITRFVPNYTCIFLEFIPGFGSYVKVLPKTKQCNSVAAMVQFGFSVYVKQPLLQIWIILLQVFDSDSNFFKSPTRRSMVKRQTFLEDSIFTPIFKILVRALLILVLKLINKKIFRHSVDPDLDPNCLQRQSFS